MSPPSRQRPRRSEKPASAFSTTRLTARRRRPPHPTVRRRPQRRRYLRYSASPTGRRAPHTGSPAGQRSAATSATVRRPPAAELPTREAPPAKEVPADCRPEGTPSRSRPHTGSPAGQRSACRRSACRLPAGRHSEQVAPLPHHLGPAAGRRHKEQRRPGPPLQCAAHRPPSSPHGKPPPTPDPAMAKSDPPVFYALRDLLVSVLAARLRFGLVSGKPKLRCSKRNRSGALYLIIARTRGIIQNTYEIC
jgi:hypothetical protein